MSSLSMFKAKVELFGLTRKQITRMLERFFNWVSKVIRVCFGFALLRSVID